MRSRTPVAVARPDQLDLVDVEAEVVEPVQPLGDAVALLLRLEHLDLGQLVPQPVVVQGDLLGDHHRVDARRQQPTGLEVEQLAGDLLTGQRDVVLAHPVRQRLLDLAGLGVDHVRGQRAGVEPEQRVRQRAVAPVEADEVQPYEQLDQRVEQPVRRLVTARVGEQRAVGDGVLEELGDQDRVEVVGPVDDDADHADRRHLVLGEDAQQPVLATGQLGVDLLQREDPSGLLDEPHDVPRDAALAHLDHPRVGPLLERQVPRQVDHAAGGVGWGREDEAHAPIVLCVPVRSRRKAARARRRRRGWRTG